MRKRIYKNIFGLGILTIVVIMIAFVYFFNHSMQVQLENEIKTEAVYVANICEQFTDTASFLKELGVDTTSRITYIDETGAVHYDNQIDVSEMENHIKRPEIIAAMENGVGVSSRISDTLRKKTYYYAVHLQNGGFIRVARNSDSLLQTFIDILPTTCILAVLILLGSFLVATKLANGVINQINSIDLHNPTNDVTFPELWPLVNRIEKQNLQISDQLADLTDQKEKFNTITTNMNEGLILLDQKSKIIFINQSCKNLFGVPSTQFIGKNIFLFNHSTQLQTTLEKALNGEIHSEILKLDEITVQFFGNPVVQEGDIQGVVLFVLDITEKQKAEKMRREFSANVSHELKTPLTSISGYAELIRNQMARPEDIPIFAEKIYNEAARLFTLVNDIIKISQLDEKDIRSSKESVDLYVIARDVVERLTSVAATNKVTLNLTGYSVKMVVARLMIEDMLYNLCENGIKYNTLEGSVTISVYEEDQHPIIKVSDTGIGIPSKYQERIFERFYRIDKSHSKQTGGTGLGLSIVKHVVEYHGGYIEIHSSKEDGTVITIHL